jgi:hypothetical protein
MVISVAWGYAQGEIDKRKAIIYKVWQQIEEEEMN